MSAAMIATTPAACNRMSRIGRLHTVLYGGSPDAGACQYTSVWWRRHDRSTFRAGLARQGSQDPCDPGLFGAEGRALVAGDGRLARQLLLALRLARRLP